MRENTYCVILAGGIGSRFWPYSRKSMPKQFLDFFGLGETLLQMTYRRLSKLFSPNHLIVATNREYIQIVKEQLPTIQDECIISEPCRRNTASTIALSTLHIAALDPSATICFAPSDHLVVYEDLFQEAVKKAMDYVHEHPVLLTIGLKPSRPDTGYGYIQLEADEFQEEPLGKFYKAKTFTEKPKEDLAKIFVDSGEFFWNSGMLFGSVTPLLCSFREHMPELMERLEGRNQEDIKVFGTAAEKDHIEERYPYCPNISMDYGVMEKSDNVHILVADFGWADLGTWGSVYDIAEKDDKENVHLHPLVLENNSKGNLVVSDREKKLIVIQGIEDTMVVEKDNVLLLCKRGEEHKLKQLVLAAAAKGEEYIE